MGSPGFQLTPGVNLAEQELNKQTEVLVGPLKELCYVQRQSLFLCIVVVILL